MRGYKRFVAMLKRAGVAHKITKCALYFTVVIYAVTGPCNEGVSGMYTTFVFDKKGDLYSVGSWDGHLGQV